MYWQRNTLMRAGGRFHCKHQSLNSHNQVRRSRRAEGLCVWCATPAEGERCIECQERHADQMATPKQQLLSQLAGIRYRRRHHDLQPTGVGLAAFAVWTEGKESNGEV
jgi:hypothetical protein